MSKKIKELIAKLEEERLSREETPSKKSTRKANSFGLADDLYDPSDELWNEWLANKLSDNDD